MELSASQRAEGNEFHHDADNPGAEHRRDQHNPDGQHTYLRHGGEDQREADVGANHGNFPMRQVQQIEHPENQRIAYGNQGITASQHQPINDLLDECGQHVRYSPCMSAVLLRRLLCRSPLTLLRKPARTYVSWVLTHGVFL